MCGLQCGVEYTNAQTLAAAARVSNRTTRTSAPASRGKENGGARYGKTSHPPPPPPPPAAGVGLFLPGATGPKTELCLSLARVDLKISRDGRAETRATNRKTPDGGIRLSRAASGLYNISPEIPRADPLINYLRSSARRKHRPKIYKR